MSEETAVEEVEQVEAASEPEQVDAEGSAEGEQKMVPLTAVQAMRKRAQEAEAKAQFYQEQLERAGQDKSKTVEEEDPNALVEKKLLNETTAQTKREILEELYQDMNPKAVIEINKHLESILRKKPWLAESVTSAPNRYARAAEIVEDYKHLVEEKSPGKLSSAASDAQRIVQNSQKPRSPVEIGKSANPTGMEFLKSVQGKKEFREYRQKVLRGEA
jgi:hypothetical protein